MSRRSKLYKFFNIRYATGFVFWLIAGMVATYYAMTKLCIPLAEDVRDYCQGICDATLFTIWRPLFLLVALSGCLMAWMLLMKRGKMNLKESFMYVVCGSIGSLAVFALGIYLVCEVNSWMPLGTDEQRLAVVESQDIRYSRSQRYHWTSVSCRSILRVLDNDSRMKMTTRKMYVNFETGDTVALTCNRGMLGLDYVRNVVLWHKPRPAIRRSRSL